MKCKISKLLFLVIFFFQFAFYKAQLDKITIQKIEVNGTAYTSTAIVPKNVPVTLKVYFNIKKNSSSSDMGNNVKLIAKRLGSNFQVFVRTLGNFPTNTGQSVDYVLTETVNNSTVLSDTSTSGNLFMTYNYGSNHAEVGSNLFPMTFIDPQISQNTISGGGTVNYLSPGPYVTGSKPAVSAGGYTYSWQKRRADMPANWWIVLSGNQQNYTPTADDNNESYILRRVVRSEFTQIAPSYSNEIEIKVNIGQNTITEAFGIDGFGVSYHGLAGSLPKGGNNVYSYQWQEKINGNWTNIAGATNNSYSLSSVTTNRTFRRIVRSAGVAESISNEFEVFGPRIVGNIINEQYFIHPQPEKVVAGEKPVFNTLGTVRGTDLVSTTGNSLTYQWQKQTAGGNWEDIPNATGVTYDTPAIQQTTLYRRIVRSGIAYSESNSMVVEVTSYPAMQNNIISFDPSNVDHILGTTPSGGDGNYLYVWAADVHPDDSIGEMVFWGQSNGTGTTMSEYINQLPITSDEYHLTRYAISDGVWHRSNTLIYSVTGGILQGKNSKKKLSAAAPAKEVIATVNENNLLFIFKNYSNTNAEIHLVNFSNGRSEKIMNVNIKEDQSTKSWTFPTQYLPGIYAYKIIFNDGSIQSGKVIKK